MRGHEQIIEARMRGYKPATVVHVDVGGSTRWQSFLAGDMPQGRVTMLHDSGALHPQVMLAPGESARTADWSWCRGLSISLDGDDPTRVQAAAERIADAGAVRVLATCDGQPFPFIDWSA